MKHPFPYNTRKRASLPSLGLEVRGIITIGRDVFKGCTRQGMEGMEGMEGIFHNPTTSLHLFLIITTGCTAFPWGY